MDHCERVGLCRPGRRLSRAVLVTAVAAVVSLTAGGAVEAEDTDMNEYLKLDDFSGGSYGGAKWEGFSDRVMGGVSELSAGIVSDGEVHYLRMSGTVSTRNNGGFIQVRLLVGSDLAPFDGSRFKGIRLVARGSGQGYYVHVRTAGMLAPWKYYSAPIEVTSEWREIDIPWSAFTPGDFGRMGTFRPDRVKSLAIVAAKKDFEASIDVREVGLYAEPGVAPARTPVFTYRAGGTGPGAN